MIGAFFFALSFVHPGLLSDSASPQYSRVQKGSAAYTVQELGSGTPITSVNDVVDYGALGSNASVSGGASAYTPAILPQDSSEFQQQTDLIRKLPVAFLAIFTLYQELHYVAAFPNHFLNHSLLKYPGLPVLLRNLRL